MSIYGTCTLWKCWSEREFGCPYPSYLGMYVYSGTSISLTDKYVLHTKNFIGSVFSLDLFNRSFCCIFVFFLFQYLAWSCARVRHSCWLGPTYFCNRRQQQRDFCYRIVFVALAISSIVGRQLTSQTFSTIIFLKG